MKNIYKAHHLLCSLLLLGMIDISCNKANYSKAGIPQKELQLILEMNLPFTEPSGLAFSEVLQKMWVVSGGNQHVYMLDMNGRVEKKLKYKGVDLEGIAFDATDSTLWVIDESTKQLSHLDLDGHVLIQKQILYSTKKINKGPEGITIGPKHLIYIVNERDPSLLIRLDHDFKIEYSYQLNFASDYSDITYDSSSNSFFILSDESKAFFLWNEQQGVICKYLLPNTKNEGIAFDQKRGVFYIVNDATAQLYIYKIKN
jgi:uncharacterized protein YjiK